MREQDDGSIVGSGFAAEGVGAVDGDEAMTDRDERHTTCVPRQEVSSKHLAGDLAGGVGGGEAGIAAGVVNDFGDLVFGKPVVAGDLEVERELVGGAQRDQNAGRDKAAVATAQPLASPEPTENVVDADLEQFVAELAVTQVVGRPTRQQLTEDLKTLFTYICHGIQSGTAPR